MQSPCDAQAPIGVHDVALFRGSHQLRVFRAVDLQPDMHLYLDYESRAGDRVIGTVLLGTMLPVGAAFIVTSFFFYFIPFVATGGVLFLVGLIVGSFFAGRNDHATLTAEPIRF